MKENIEEVIKFLQGFNDGYTFQQCQTCFKFNEKDSCCNKEKCEELKAIEFLISDYKRVLKENEELKHKYDKALSDVIAGVDLDNTYIPVQKIKDKIEELNEYYKKEIYPALVNWADIDITEYYDSMIETLQDLLEEKGE